MDYIVNAVSILTVIISNFFTNCKIFFQSIINFFNSAGSILETIWFGLKTMLSGLWALISELFNGSLFDYIYNGFNDLSYYIGFNATTFISGLLFVAMIRICIGFVFKMFRLNVDYKTMKTKWNDPIK